MEVEKISETFIKPSSPTPRHLKTYKLSGIDQRSTSIYTPLVLFYSGRGHVDTFIHETSSSLKRSLSDTLTLFYPFAAKTPNGNVSIDCTDDGAYYLEARVVDPSCTLARYLGNDVVTDLTTVAKLLPVSNGVSIYGHPAPGSHMLLIQTTFFPCGGFAIGLLFSHKIADGPSFASFLRAWASASASVAASPHHRVIDSDRYRPLLSGETVFPPNESFVESASIFTPSTRRRPRIIGSLPVPAVIRRSVVSQLVFRLP